MPFVLAALAVWMITANWPSTAAVIWGGLLLFAAWVLLPAWQRMPKNLLSRDQAPLFYALVDKVAAANGARPVHAVIVSAEYGASYQEVGPMRRPVIMFGLPLWTVLSPQERIAFSATNSRTE